MFAMGAWWFLGLSPANLSLGTVRALQPVLTARPTPSATSQGEGRAQPALHADAAHRRIDDGGVKLECFYSDPSRHPLFFHL